MKAWQKGAIVGAFAGFIGTVGSSHCVLATVIIAASGAITTQANHMFFKTSPISGGVDARIELGTVGGLWGLLSSLGFFIQFSRHPINEIDIIYFVMFLPGSIAARIVFAPEPGPTIMYPILSIFVGTAIGYILGGIWESQINIEEHHPPML